MSGGGTRSRSLNQRRVTLSPSASPTRRGPSQSKATSAPPMPEQEQEQEQSVQDNDGISSAVQTASEFPTLWAAAAAAETTSNPSGQTDVEHPSPQDGRDEADDDDDDDDAAAAAAADEDDDDEDDDEDAAADNDDGTDLVNIPRHPLTWPDAKDTDSASANAGTGINAGTGTTTGTGVASQQRIEAERAEAAGARIFPTVKAQAAERGFMARRAVRAAKAAVTVVQAHARGRRVLKELLRRSAAATTIQSAARTFMSSVREARLGEEQRDMLLCRTRAAVTMQR